MHREPDTTEPRWLPLHEASERLSSYLSNSTGFVLNESLARGRVPVLAMRGDLPTMLPDRVEDMLAKARRVFVIAHNDVIRADYLFSGEQDIQQVFGPRSDFTLAELEPRRFPLIINMDFGQVRVCWATLMRELRQIGWHPADEQAAILRKNGLWPDSWGPIGSGRPADESPQGAGPRGGTLTPAPAPEIHKAIKAANSTAQAAPAASIDDPLADWIFAQHSRRMSCEALYAEARRAPPREFRKADFVAAYGKVYATQRHRPPATGWPLRSPYKERLTQE
jgi:hypothetical protein